MLEEYEGMNAIVGHDLCRQYYLPCGTPYARNITAISGISLPLNQAGSQPQLDTRPPALEYGVVLTTSGEVVGGGEGSLHPSHPRFRTWNTPLNNG